MKINSCLISTHTDEKPLPLHHMTSSQVYSNTEGAYNDRLQHVAVCHGPVSTTSTWG